MISEKIDSPTRIYRLCSYSCSTNDDTIDCKKVGKKKVMCDAYVSGATGGGSGGRAAAAAVAGASGRAAQPARPARARRHRYVTSLQVSTRFVLCSPPAGSTAVLTPACRQGSPSRNVN